MTRPQKVTNLRDAENRKISTWLPPNGTGIGLWRGRRVYYVNGKRQSGLTIRNPMGDSIGNTLKGLTIQGAKDLYTITGARSIVENPGSLGILDPRVWQAAVRTRKNIAQLGVKPPKKQSKEVLENIARNQAKLMTEGFGTELTETTPFKNQITSDKQVAKKVIKQDKEDLKVIKSQLTDPKEINKVAQMEQLVDDNTDKVNSGFPAEVSEVEKQKGRTRWVGANTTWKDRWGNVIAPKVKGPTKEEQKRMIMTSLEQEMYW
tara:strand:- start:148 stop:933 length:786 start_codon:yes stop_codon:yes gene_type:complete